MDMNDMRRKFREKKAQKENSSTSSNVEENARVSEFEKVKNSTPTKSGESSTVSLSESSYDYAKGTNHVSFSCSRLDNTCDETTGFLSLHCWISEKTREDGNWQNDNYAFVNSIELGVLEKGYGFTDINHTFEIPDNLVKVINDMNNDEAEWHFIFTINELHEDGNNYIIHTINGQSENKKEWLPILDNSISVVRYQEKNIFVYLDGEEFSGSLYSSDVRFIIEVKKSVVTGVVIGFHKNGKVALCGNLNDDTVPQFYDDQDNEISEDVFEKQYGQEFEKIFAAGWAELESKIENNSASNNMSSNYGDSFKASNYALSDIELKVKSIIVEKLGCEEYQVTLDASFTNDLGADSLDAVELIMEFEKEFGITIADEDFKKILTVGDAIAYLAAYSS